MSDIKNQLKQRMNELGYTQASLGRELGLSRQNINRAIGQRNNVYPTLSRILEVLKLEVTLKEKE